MFPDFYTHRAEWPAQVESILEAVGRLMLLEELSGRSLELRRTHRIGSVHSSTAIEGNTLSLAQVEDLAHGRTVLAAPREVLEVRNALAAYEALGDFDPWNAADFLRAHSLLTAGLITESGAYRTVDVEIVNAEGEVLHTGSRAAKVPKLVEELLEWGASAPDHPLIVSSAVHFMIEQIHPFRDGNGRIGRLWQTLILSRWRDVFAWMPIETLIREHQEGYYSALQDSRDPEIDAAPFVDYMLGVVAESLHAYAARASGDAPRVGVNGGANGGVNDAILMLLRAEPSLSAVALAAKLELSSRTVERHLAELKAAGLIRREGAPKRGRWVVSQPEG